MARSAGNVRIGPISFITLVAVLLLSVMAVLCVTTANASKVMASRHTTTLTETYAVDSAGQALVAQIDGVLANQRDAEATAEEATSELASVMPLLTSAALEAVDADGVEIAAQAANNRVTLQIAAPGGRTLNATVSIDDDLGYSITEWKMSLTQEEQQETLWSGSSTN